MYGHLAIVAWRQIHSDHENRDATLVILNGPGIMCGSVR
jgi:hypothetical protein